MRKNRLINLRIFCDFFRIFGPFFIFNTINFKWIKLRKYVKIILKIRKNCENSFLNFLRFFAIFPTIYKTISFISIDLNFWKKRQPISRTNLRIQIQFGRRRVDSLERERNHFFSSGRQINKSAAATGYRTFSS